MIARLIFTVVTFCLLFCGLAQAETLVSVDPKARVLNVDTGGGLKAYRLQDPVEVRVDGVLAQLEQLRPGMQVTLGLAGGQIVVRIVAVSAKPTAGTTTLIDATRHLEIKAKVDGTDLVTVANGKMWIEHADWSKPTDLWVNGHRWKPVWTGNKSDEYVDIVPPLAPFAAATVGVKKQKGRGSVTIKQSPTAENGWTLIVEFNDSKESGAAEYEARISW